MSVTTLYSNKTGYLFEGRVFKYTAGTEVIGEKGIRIDPRRFIRGGGLLNIFSRTPGVYSRGGLFEQGVCSNFKSITNLWTYTRYVSLATLLSLPDSPHMTQVDPRIYRTEGFFLVER